MIILSGFKINFIFELYGNNSDEFDFEGDFILIQLPFIHP